MAKKKKLKCSKLDYQERGFKKHKLNLRAKTVLSTKYEGRLWESLRNFWCVRARRTIEFFQENLLDCFRKIFVHKALLSSHLF